MQPDTHTQRIKATASGCRYIPVRVVRKACRGGNVKLVEHEEGVEVAQSGAADAPPDSSPLAFRLLSGQDHLEGASVRVHIDNTGVRMLCVGEQDPPGGPAYACTRCESSPTSTVGVMYVTPST